MQPASEAKQLESRQSQCAAEFAKLNKIVNLIQDALTAVEERFGPVLGSPATTPEAPPQPHPVVVPAAEEIREQRLRLEHVLGRLQSMRDRCEL